MRVLYQSTWLVEETVRYSELRILERAVLKAPEGKFLTLTVNGVGHEIVPGLYVGDVVLSVTEAYTMQPHSLLIGCGISRDFCTALVIEDGKVSEEKCVGEMLRDGTVSDAMAEGLYLASDERGFNGVVVDGDSEYLIKNVKVDFEGESDNDFIGAGTAVTAVGNSKVTVEDCSFTFSGMTRCAVHAGGSSNVLVRNTRIVNLSPKSDWLGSFSWAIGVKGTHRLLQVADAANVTYENCLLKSNGWGVCSIDGTMESMRMVIRNSQIELSGPNSHGYGAFCIGENEVELDGCQMDVSGYPLMLMGMEGLGRATIKDCEVKSRRFGVFVIGDDNSILNISGSRFKTKDSFLCVKGSSTVINVENTSAAPGNGTLLQLMDTEESGMDVTVFYVPVGVKDEYIPGRDLTVVSPTEDVALNVTNCCLEGNIFNSTSNIRAYQKNVHGALSQFQDTTLGVDPDAVGNVIIDATLTRHGGDDLRGPKNLLVSLNGSKLTGAISAAEQFYREGLLSIDENSRRELSNIIQKPAPCVNNGMVVRLANGSTWTVSEKSYISALAIDSDSAICAADGKKLVMTVNGKRQEPLPGSYVGSIELWLE